MIALMDVDYRAGASVAAAVLAEGWTDASPVREWSLALPPAAPYQPGRFYLRELPCLRALLEGESPTTVVVDCYVWLSGPPAPRPGLGAHLFWALGGRSAVVGVAKRPFAGACLAVPVVRGASGRPLYVTAAGIPLETAAAAVQGMHGAHRIPTLMRRVDRLCRTSHGGRVRCR